MYRHLIGAVFIVLALMGSRSAAAVNWIEPSPLVSRVLGEEVLYRVSVPEGYGEDPSTRYPLLVVLDGTRYGEVVADNERFLARVDEIPQHVIVAVDSNNRLRDYSPTDSPNWEGDGGAAFFLEFLTTELLPEVERAYRLRRPYILWGHSAAGLFTLHTLHAAPMIFDARLVNDGSLDWDDRAPERATADYLAQGPVPRQFLYFNSSFLLETAIPSDDYFRSFAELLSSRAPDSLRWVYDPLPTESHASIPLVGSIRALRALYEGYLVPESILFEGLDAVERHYASIRGRVGAPDQVPESVLNSLGYAMLHDHPDQAVRSFEMATRLYPQSANAWDSLSDGYLAIDDFERALTATEKSLVLIGPDDEDLRAHLSKKLEKIRRQL